MNAPMRLRYLPDDEAYELAVAGRSFYGRSLARLVLAAINAALRRR